MSGARRETTLIPIAGSVTFEELLEALTDAIESERVPSDELCIRHANKLLALSKAVLIRIEYPSPKKGA